jgi:diadenylate cyclase
MFAVDPPDRETIEAVIEAADMLSERKIGALIAIERQIGLRAVIETGTVIDARVSWPLLSTIFFPRTTLHDGGTVIQGNRISAAGCVFPLSPQEGLNRSLGTRHRAAIGLTEETDALVVVVSEETGTISVAFNGRLSRGLDLERLRRTLNTIVKRTRPAREGRLMRMRRMMTKTGKDAVAPTKPRNEDAGHAG